jgi:hypothetical protein
MKLLAWLGAPVLALTTVLSMAAPASAAVPDRKAWVAYNHLAGAVVGYGTWPAATTVLVIGVGRYQVKFPGQGIASGGIVHVTAVHGTAHWCQAETWFISGADEFVNVKCFKVGGIADPSSFTAFFTRSSGLGAGGPYGYVDSQATGVLVAQYNSSGAANTSTHTGAGQWQVNFPGLVTPSPMSGGLQATAVNTATGARCKIAQWQSLATGQDVKVWCFDSAGAFLDTRFTLTFQYKTSLYGATIPPKYHGFLYNAPPLGAAPTNFNAVLGFGANTIISAGFGLSLVTFPRVGFPQNTVLVTAAGMNSNFCGLNTFWINSGPGPDVIVRDVNCFTNTGAATNTGFLVSTSSIL